LWVSLRGADFPAAYGLPFLWPLSRFDMAFQYSADTGLPAFSILFEMLDDTGG
jgi:hypothetical protein